MSTQNLSLQSLPSQPMLPLVQVHHKVHPQSNHQAVPSHYSRHNPSSLSGDQLPQILRDPISFQSSKELAKAIPIRNLQPGHPIYHRTARLSLPSYVADQNEYQLRRKTPNGTLHAGYDGSPTQLAQGPPPLKHMILSAPPAASVSSRPQMGHSIYSAYPSSLRANGLTSQVCDSHTFDAVQPTSITQCPRSSLHDFQQQRRYSADPSTPRFHGAIYDISNGPERWPTWYSAQPQPPYDTLTARAGCPGAPHAFDHIDSRPARSQRRDFGSTPPRNDLGCPPSLLQTSYPAVEFLAIGSNSFQPDMSTAPHFREKTLTQAYRAYMDLLTQLHHMRKAGPSSLSSSALSKLLVYPKPSKPTPWDPNIALRGPAHATEVSFTNTRTRATRFPPADMTFVGTPPVEWDAGPKHAPVVPTAMMPCHALPMEIHKGSPSSSAKASLETLTHLCEQSDWKWIDGMMLGGCLLYGLDRFEDASDWFSRIIELNANNVEAMSNKAATLFCLNRQEEAEKLWLEAIRIRPQFIEAAEHLVGLLYKKRGREAVRIIDFVQRSLKLPGVTSHSRELDSKLARNSESSDSQTRTSSLPLSENADGKSSGFGSSGYAIPAAENGRMLALVHAKGTMLYSLKEVDRASQSFEEAVLISAGRQFACVRDLVLRVQSVLSHDQWAPATQGIPNTDTLPPLLLPPERARNTAGLVFPGRGKLPGLVCVPNGGPRRAAIQTTSNSLLSLAKIYQDTMSSAAGSSVLNQRPSGINDILALYYLSLSLQESPSTANNVGILLASVQQAPSATSQFMISNRLQASGIPGILPGSGLALALSYYNYGLSLDPKHVHLHTNLGSLLKDIGQLDLAIQMYEQAVSCDGTFDIALTNLANAVKDRGRTSDAIAYYKRAVLSNPDFAEAVCGLFTALNSVCDWRGRGGLLLPENQYDRWHVDDDGMLVDAAVQRQASGLTKKVVDIVRKQLEEASTWGIGALPEEYLTIFVSQLQHAQAFAADDAFKITSGLRSWSRNQWEGSRILRFVERSTKAVMRRWYCDTYILDLTTRSTYNRPLLPPALTVPSAPTVLPFHTFTCPLTAQDVRMISQRNALRISCSTLRAPWLPRSVYRPPPPPSPQLNVGYVSSDFNNHPLAHLMQSVFGFHEKTKVKALCYATTASDGSVHRLQIEREAPVFRDASSWPSDRIIEQIVADEIHILVNLNGYTRGARNEIFAARPAPIQMSFMGFAGTLGAEWCDYILADTTAIPPSTLRPWRGNLHVPDVFQDQTEEATGDWIYSENVIFCRDTFFCCDHAQSCSPEERHLSWEDEQRRRWQMRKELFPSFSDDTVILGNFNQLYKIDPSTFRSWLRILSRVPKAVLWLLRFPELGETNLKRTAKAWAGAEVASRIIFTDVAPKHLHIARARVCDLFLDTPECNAHTTAADVLWSSTPLLTFPRYSFKMCSRMAASILKGALPKGPEGQRAAQELIASSDEEYESLAIRLASSLAYNGSKEYGEGAGRLAELRYLLWRSKWSCALFDTRRWVADLELAYQEAWRRWVAGEDGDIYL